MRTIDIQYHTSNNEIPTMVFSGTKKSILLLGRLLVAAAQCRYDKNMLRNFLEIRNDEDVKIYIRQAAEQKNGLHKLRGQEQTFSWSVPAIHWKKFSTTLAMLRSGRISELFSKPIPDFDLMITLGNRV